MMNSRPTRKNEKRGPLKRIADLFGKLMENKIFLALFSLAIAFIVWAIMVASDGSLTRRKVFNNASVSVTGEATLISRGYIVTDNITELVPTVDMIIQTTQANYDRATAAAYNPHFELTQVTGEGENTLSIVYTSQAYGQVISCEPNSVTVNVERYITRRVPVVVELSGKLPAGYYLKSYRSDPTTLSVSGPQSQVTSVSRIVVHLDQASLSSERLSDRLALEIELQSADGTVIESDKLTVTNQSVITSAITVETELIPQKAVALDTEAFVTGTPAEGFVLSEIQLAENSIQVAASEEILSAITVITTDDPLDITDAEETQTGYVRLRRLTGIESTLPTEIGVTAVIEETSTTRTFRSLNLSVKGLSGLEATLSPVRTNVHITGPYTWLNGLSPDEISLSVDVTDLEAGTYILPLTVSIDNAPDYTVETDADEIQVTLR